MHPYVYRYVKGDLQTDLSLALYALKKDVGVYDFVRGALKNNARVKEILRETAYDETKGAQDRAYAMRMLGLKK